MLVDLWARYEAEPTGLDRVLKEERVRQRDELRVALSGARAWLAEP